MRKVNHYIYAPAGGLGNHIRWLCLLDDQFNFLNLITYSNLLTENKTKRVYTLSDKVNFILETIYPASRSWQNWIKIESKYRFSLDSLIFFEHKVGYQISSDQLAVYVNTSPDLCLQHYFKFNSNLNGCSIASFKMDIMHHNHSGDNSSVNCINGDNLFQETLPKDTYSSIISELNLANNYDEAAVIHKAWYTLNKKGEKDMVKFINDFYKNNQ
jgi:hypothetical protein